MARDRRAFDRVVTPARLRWRCSADSASRRCSSWRCGWRPPSRRAPTWGCGGLLTAAHGVHGHGVLEAADDDLRAVYRPTREVEALAKVSPYFPQEVRYHVEIEPTFERYVYGPLTDAVLRVADGMKVLQAGSLHAYLGYVIALVVESRAHGVVEQMR